MANARCVPSTLYTWPSVVDLLPDQKHIASYLWFNRFANSCGCYALPRELAAVELSFSAGALNEALLEFERRNFVALDKITTEIYVLAWFRFNKFPPGPRRRILEVDVSRIESTVLRALVEKSISCIPKENKARKVNIAIEVEARPGESMPEFLARRKKAVGGGSDLCVTTQNWPNFSGARSNGRPSHAQMPNSKNNLTIAKTRSCAEARPWLLEKNPEVHHEARISRARESGP